MKNLKYFAVWSAMLLGGMSGCSSSPAIRQYVLEPVASAADYGVEAEAVIAVGPVTLPERLNRRTIVGHSEQFRVSSAEFDRWAEPLDENIARAVAENLSILNQSGSFIPYPSALRAPADVTVRIFVHEFGDTPSGEVVLRASWNLTSPRSSPNFHETHVSEIRSDDEIVSMVAAMSRLVEKLSREIAAALSGNR